jgi:hypothetical protein
MRRRLLAPPVQLAEWRTAKPTTVSGRRARKRAASTLLAGQACPRLPVPELSGLSLACEGLHETGDERAKKMRAGSQLLGLRLASQSARKDGFLKRRLADGKVQPRG